jgi:hypothetical protein
MEINEVFTNLRFIAGVKGFNQGSILQMPVSSLKEFSWLVISTGDIILNKKRIEENNLS